MSGIGVLCIAGPAEGQSWRYADVNFPVALDTFVSQSTFRWVGRPQLGMSLTYVIPGDEATELTVYVYPIRSEDTVATLMRFDKTPVTSLLYVFVRNRTYLKFRLSYLESAGPALRPHIVPLIQQALAIIEEPPGGK